MLLTEEKYSLEDLNTVKLMFSIVKDDSQIATIFSYNNCNGDDFVEFLKKFGFSESASMLIFFKNCFLEKGSNISKKAIFNLIEEYINQKE